MIMFRFSKKATKFEKIFHVKLSGRLLQIFVTFSECPNFTSSSPANFYGENFLIENLKLVKFDHFVNRELFLISMNIRRAYFCHPTICLFGA